MVVCCQSLDSQHLTTELNSNTFCTMEPVSDIPVYKSCRLVSYIGEHAFAFVTRQQALTERTSRCAATNCFCEVTITDTTEEIWGWEKKRHRVLWGSFTYKKILFQTPYCIILVSFQYKLSLLFSVNPWHDMDFSSIRVPLTGWLHWFTQELYEGVTHICK